MSLFKQIKCYLSCAIVAWFIYHISTTCPLCQPLPVDSEGADAICLQSHKAYAYIRPYSEPVVHQAVDYYNESPVKPLVDQYYPTVEQEVKNVYGMISKHVELLVERLNNNELSNAKNIVIPDEYDAFTKPVGEAATTPNEDVVEPTPVPEHETTNKLVETDENSEEQITAVDATAIPENTGSASEIADDVVVEDKESKLEKFVHEAEAVVKAVAAEEIIEAAEAVGQQL